MTKITSLSDHREKKTAKAKGPAASFCALYLAALQPVYDYAMETEAERLEHGALTITPCEHGGIHIAVTCHHMAAIIYDANGKATGPMTLAIPADGFQAATPPPPTRFIYGAADEYTEAEPPEWMQPGKVYFNQAGMIIMSKMPHPSFAESKDWPCLFNRCSSLTMKDHLHGVDYHLEERIQLDWRKLQSAKAEKDALLEVLTFNPSLPLILQQVSDILHGDEMAINHHRPAIMPGNLHRGWITTNSHAPEFLAIWMPMSPEPQMKIPAHFGIGENHG